MTCIVGFVDSSSGVVTIGGDSAGVGGSSLTVRNDPKVFNIGDMVFGFTSSFRMGQILMYKFAPPPRNGLTPHKYMATVFVDELRKCLSENGIAKIDNGVESCGTFLVGMPGALFTVDSDYQVGINRQPYAACGAGAEIAMGAMYTVPPSCSPEQKVRLALMASEEFCTDVRSPFNFVSTS